MLTRGAVEPDVCSRPREPVRVQEPVGHSQDDAGGLDLPALLVQRPDQPRREDHGRPLRAAERQGLQERKSAPRDPSLCCLNPVSSGSPFTIPHQKLITRPLNVLHPAAVPPHELGRLPGLPALGKKP